MVVMERITDRELSWVTGLKPGDRVEFDDWSGHIRQGILQGFSILGDLVVLTDEGCVDTLDRGRVYE